MSEIIRRSKTVKFGGNDVTVRELSLLNFGKVGKVLASIADQPKIMEAFQSGDTTRQAGAMAGLLQVVPEKVAEVIGFSTGLDPKDVLEHGMSDVVDLLLEVWDMNNFVDLFQKKLGGVLSKVSAAPEPKVAKSPSAPVVVPKVS